MMKEIRRKEIGKRRKDKKGVEKKTRKKKVEKKGKKEVSYQTRFWLSTPSVERPRRRFPWMWLGWCIG